MKVFFTSNLQFGRPGAIKQFKRPFATVAEMNQTLMTNWNSTVKEEDVVYVLGNFAWDPTIAEEMLGKLNGHIVIVPGELDEAVLELKRKGIMPKKTGIIESVFSSKSEQLTVSYWPLMEWPSKSEGHYLFFGYPSAKYKTDHKKKMVNVSCDFWGYKPQSLDSVIELFKDIESTK